MKRTHIQIVQHSLLQCVWISVCGCVAASTVHAAHTANVPIVAAAPQRWTNSSNIGTNTHISAASTMFDDVHKCVYTSQLRYLFYDSRRTGSWSRSCATIKPPFHPAQMPHTLLLRAPSSCSHSTSESSCRQPTTDNRLSRSARERTIDWQNVGQKLSEHGPNRPAIRIERQRRRRRWRRCWFWHCNDRKCGRMQ